MAKARKQVLSLEEQLEQALIPESERPYSIPENWVWTKLENVGEIVTGGTPSKKNPEYYNGSFPFYKPSDLDKGRHVYNATEYLTENGKAISRIVPVGSTSVCCIGTIGKCGFLLREGTTNQQINSVIPRIEPLLIYYYCCTDLFVQQLLALSSATTISIVNKSKMSSCSFPLPPLAEQQRIVSQIESLFQKLDSARDLVQDALDSFETRKAAILHKAFTGELTANWRIDNDIEKDSWHTELLGDHLDSIQAGKSFRCMERPPTSEEVGIVKVSAVTWGVFKSTESKTCIDKSLLNEQYLIKDGDFLFSRANTLELVGACLIATNVEGQLMLSDKILRFVFAESISPKYVNYYLKSSAGRGQIQSLTTGNQESMRNISQNNIKKIQIPLPSYLEQQEIVRVLDSLLENEQKAKDLCDILDQIDLMKKSILARAFRGELGINDPSEESALELLKDVLAKAENK